MRHALVLLLATAALALAPTADAQIPDTAITLEADDGDSCLDQDALNCFRVTEGSLEDLQTGMLVHVTLQNAGENPHNAYVTEASNADTDTRDTSTDDAINGSDTIDPGDETTFMFTVPEGADGLYAWCSVGTHEATGMYLDANVEQAPPEEGDNEDENQTQDPGNETEDPDPDDAQGLPFLTLPALATLMALVAAATRR